MFVNFQIIKILVTKQFKPTKIFNLFLVDENFKRFNKVSVKLKYGYVT